MGCASNVADGSLHAATLRVVFRRFWPPHLAFPPIAPYLVGAVNRAEAERWFVELGADDPTLLSGDTVAVLDFVGRSMAGGGRFAAARRKKKREGGGRPAAPQCPIVVDRFYNAECGVWQTVTAQCNGTFTYDPPCGALGGGPGGTIDPDRIQSG